MFDFKVLMAAVAVTVTALGVGAATASTLAPGTHATFDVSGTWETTGAPGPGAPTGNTNTLSIGGSWVANLLQDGASVITPYVLSADVTATSEERGDIGSLLGGPQSIVTPPTTSDALVDLALATLLDQIGPFGPQIMAFLDAANPGPAVAPIPDFGILTFAWGDPVLIGPTSVAGVFTLGVETDQPLLGEANWANDSGTFEVALSIAPIPVPAALPMLGLAVFGLWAVRRRRVAG